MLVRPKPPSAFVPGRCASDLVQKGRFPQYMACAQVACDPVAHPMGPQRIHHGTPAHFPWGPSALARTVNSASRRNKRTSLRATGGAVPLRGAEIQVAPEVPVSNKARDADCSGRGNNVERGSSVRRRCSPPVARHGSYSRPLDRQRSFRVFSVRVPIARLPGERQLQARR